MALRLVPPELIPVFGFGRRFDEMTQPDSHSFFLGNLGPSGRPAIEYERRRISHPYNEASQTNSTSHSGTQGPSLEQYTSQTIINLTDDSAEHVPRGVNARFLHRRPHLGRSDALVLEDMTDPINNLVNGESWLEPAEQENDRSHRELPHAQHHHRSWLDGLPLFFPNVNTGPAQVPHPIEEAPIFGPDGFANYVQTRVEGERIEANRSVLNMGYDQDPSPFQTIPAKPQHQSPLAAREGFTRSPVEDDIVICPACQKELVAKKGENKRTSKRPGGKPLNKKDREEHPFWVVKACGHVYCNVCYQRRRPGKSNISPFPGSTTAGQVHLICAVEGCGENVGGKIYWVGVFI